MKYSSSEHPITWFRDRYVEGTLIIKPPYQRKPVWKERQKCSLIESILMELPIPEIYIQQVVSENEKTIYAVVDGQQRMRAILQFVGSETEENEREYNRFTLDKLTAESPWSNRGFADLTPEDKKKFLGYRLAVRYLDTENEGEIRDMFARLNQFLTPLKPQELRNAIYRGPFTKLVTKYADNEYWAENRIVTAEAIRRMGDVEFVSELFIGLLHGPQAGSPGVINDYYAQYEDYEDEFPEQKSVTKNFDETWALIRELFPDIKQTRWSNKTDFYTLFAAIGALLKANHLAGKKHTDLRRALSDFADDVGLLLSNEKARVSENVRQYVEALIRGANDKSRRAARHEALTGVIQPMFAPKRPRGSPV
jgi:hypothetical protein